MSPLPSSPMEEQSSSQEANKENAPVQRPAAQALEPGQLPKQIADQLADIASHLQTFSSYPPHTVQRLAELILSPRAHYKALASYLHAVDRVVQVTSGTDRFPLPPLVPDMSLININGEGEMDPAEAVAWSNPTTAASVGSDEALGGALLTPIPWLARRSPESSEGTPGAQIHSESTETIDGPNGMGSIETVSVSVNGVPSMGHARGITQGELLRQEQRAGVVPVSQLTRSQASSAAGEHERPVDAEEGKWPPEDEEDEVPHARGPEEIGVGDTGPQGQTTSYMGEGGVEMQNIDVEAAVGRKHADGETPESEEATTAKDEDDDTKVPDAGQSPGAESTGSKREAEQVLEPETTKKVKEDEQEPEGSKTDDSDSTLQGDAPAEKTEEAKADEQADKMETDK